MKFEFKKSSVDSSFEGCSLLDSSTENISLLDSSCNLYSLEDSSLDMHSFLESGKLNLISRRKDSDTTKVTSVSSGDNYEDFVHESRKLVKKIPQSYSSSSSIAKTCS